MYPLHLVGKLVVDERAVREGEEDTVPVSFAQRDDVPLAHERFAAGINIEVGAELLALPDDPVEQGAAHGELGAVFRGPASGAFEVAGRGGVHQDGPGDIAVFPFRRFFSLVVVQDGCVDDKVGKQHPPGLRVQIGIDVFQKEVPVVLLVFHHVAHGLICRLVEAFPVQAFTQRSALGTFRS
jgi:hypothetical protein